MMIIDEVIRIEVQNHSFLAASSFFFSVAAFSLASRRLLAYLDLPWPYSQIVSV